MVSLKEIVMEINSDHMLFLLGAGASVEAGIPISSQMVSKIEGLINSNDDWKPFKDLYFYLKSSINYSDGIMGKFDESFNVERLLIVISEIEKREGNIMYPFIGSWNIRLLDLAGTNFENITKFQKLIRGQLNNWVRIKNYENASYYEAFDSLQSEIAGLIKVFTLNYDLCFERILGKQKVIEVGFNKGTKDWHYSNFENPEGKHFFLYKLHGSIDWYQKNNDDTKFYISDDPVEKPELIFGIQHKMTSVDPYFFYSSELRKACFNDARLIVVIGYSFADEYVNMILSQALKTKDFLKILSVGPLGDSNTIEKEQNAIAGKLKIANVNQILVENKTAGVFMTEIMGKEYFANHIGEPEDVPFKSL